MTWPICLVQSGTFHLLLPVLEKLAYGWAMTTCLFGQITSNAGELTAVVTCMQLHQLDSEVLQHAQQKAERFGRGRPKLSGSARRSEGDPFAEAAPDGRYDDLPSASEEEDAGNAHLIQPPCKLHSGCCLQRVKIGRSS